MADDSAYSGAIHRGEPISSAEPGPPAGPASLSPAPLSPFAPADDADLLQALTPWLRPGEELIWVGRPDAKVVFTTGDLFLIPFSIMWGGFALFWEASVLASGGPAFFALWGIPFVAMGLYLMVGRFFYRSYKRRRTAYGLTAHRALIVDGTRLREAPTIGIERTITRSRNGRHVSVIFGSPGAGRGGMPVNNGMEIFSGNRPTVPTFDDVADVDRLLWALNATGGRPPSPVATPVPSSVPAPPPQVRPGLGWDRLAPDQALGTCPRCGIELGPDERFCPSCRSDRDARTF